MLEVTTALSCIAIQVFLSAPLITLINITIMRYPLDFKVFIVVFSVLMSMLFLQCSKEEIITKEIFVEQNEEVDVEWMFPLNDELTLTYTDGLVTMALTGNVRDLNKEFGNIGTFNKRIPSNNELGDDPEGDDYATQITLGDYIIAMYHPTTYPDHFITYNWKNGSWTRWDLSEGPGVFRQSN